MTTYLRGKVDEELAGELAGELAVLLQAVAAEARPLLAEGCTGRIVINFGGGDKVRIEAARFQDVRLLRREVMRSPMR